MNRLFFYLLLISSVTFADIETRCGGEGGGPKPLEDISTSFTSEANYLQVKGDVKEFLLWENIGKIIYRNASGDILQLKTGSENYAFAHSNQPLARVKDPMERYLASEASPSVYDTRTNRWYHYKLEARPFRHLFFDKVPLTLNRYGLYSLSMRLDEKNNQYISVYEYRIGDSSAYRVCDTLKLPQGEHYTLANGHSFPYIYFYRHWQDEEQRTRLSVFSMDIGGACKLKPIKVYTRPIEGPVKSVEVFPFTGAFAAQVVHPTMNLLWDSKTGCRYFNVNQLKPMIPNRNLPIALTYSQEQGLVYIHLDKQQKVGLSQGIGSEYEREIVSITDRDVALTDDGKGLYVTPSTEFSRPMLKVTVPTP